MMIVRRTDGFPLVTRITGCSGDAQTCAMPESKWKLMLAHILGNWAAIELNGFVWTPTPTRRGEQDVGLKFLGKSSFVDLALVVGSTKFQGDGEEMELGPNKWPGSHALQGASLGSTSMCSASS